MKRNAYMTFSDWAASPEDAAAPMTEHGATTTAKRGHEAIDADPWSRMHREVLVRARRGLVGTQCRSGQNPPFYPMRRARSGATETGRDSRERIEVAM